MFFGWGRKKRVKDRSWNGEDEFYGDRRALPIQFSGLIWALFVRYVHSLTQVHDDANAKWRL